MHLATLVAGSLEAALGQLLKYHPHPRPLAKCHGQVIQLQLAELPWPLFLIMDEPIAVYSQYGADVDAQLNISLSTLAAIRNGESLSELVKQQKLEITGDMQLVGLLAQLLAAIEFDPTDPLSKVVGDGMAHRIHKTGVGLFSRGQQHAKRAQAHLGEFLVEEQHLAPAPEQMRQFCDDVDALALRVDQIAQRLTKLED